MYLPSKHVTTFSSKTSGYMFRYVRYTWCCCYKLNKCTHFLQDSCCYRIICFFSDGSDGESGITFISLVFDSRLGVLLCFNFESSNFCPEVGKSIGF